VASQSPDEDSARWLGFPFRDGDIVISTRSKTGTTWVQMICARELLRKLTGEPEPATPRRAHGAGREILTADELAAYHARVSRLAPPDLLAWLHPRREDQ
jgi:hypothetical protein